MPEGIVRWFDVDRGFGFIDLGSEADDLFVHASEIAGDDGPKLLREGRSSSSRSARAPVARRRAASASQVTVPPMRPWAFSAS